MTAACTWWAPGHPAAPPVEWYPCNRTVAKTWDHKPHGELVNPNSWLCLADPGNTTGSALAIAACTTRQLWTLPTTATAERK